MNPVVVTPFQRAARNATMAGLAAAAVCAAGALFNRPQFFHSWLVAWLFFAGLSCGALVIVMMQSLTGGEWGAVVQRLAEAAMLTLPLMALLFVPVLIGVHDLFPWSRPEALAAHPKWRHKQGYLNLPFFAARAFLFFAALGALALFIRRWSVRRDMAGRGQLPERRLRALSAGGLVVYAVCMTFASTDWIMSIEPDWYSTIFVVILMAGQFLSALALATALLALLAGEEPFAGRVTARHFHDLGNLLLAFAIFWAYVSYSQFLVIWSGNLPREISWYLHRSAGEWKAVAVFLAVFQFALPVGLLLSREMKLMRERLGFISAMIVVANIVNVYWLVAPAFHPEGVRIHWLDFATLAAVGGLWTATFLWFLSRRPLLPKRAGEDVRHA